MKLIDRGLFDQKKQKLLEKFASADESSVSPNKDSEDAAALDRAVFDLVVDLFVIQRGLDPENKTIRARFESSVREKLAAFDPNEPEATHSAKILRLLGGGQIGSATSYADLLGQHKTKEFSNAQTARASVPRTNPFNDLLANLLRTRPSLSTADAITAIRNSKGIFPIQDIDDELIYVYKAVGDENRINPATKTYFVSGLDVRLARIRRALQEGGKTKTSKAGF